MAIVLTLNESLEQIIVEAERLSDLEQKEVLAYLRALNISKKKRKPIAKPERGEPPLSMERIDHIKHESIKHYAEQRFVLGTNIWVSYFTRSQILPKVQSLRLTVPQSSNR